GSLLLDDKGMKHPMVAKQENRHRDPPKEAQNESDRGEELNTAADAELASGADGQPRMADWSGLVTRIQTGDGLAMEELYEIFSRGIRFHLCRQLGPQELDDKV